MKVGDGFTCMGGCNFGSEPYLITFEKNVRLSGNVTFVTHDGGTWAFRDMSEYADVIKYGKIHVGERTFIGCNVTVMPGVKIGKRCVIGAGSVVTKDIPDETVVAGVPARPLMTTQKYADVCLASQKPYDKERYMADKRNYLLEFLVD
ncbi:MAG: acyltransferase [Ruminococcaceae bacterium]|nr:acyltransferase [Oscillospiraceae bacterium]